VVKFVWTLRKIGLIKPEEKIASVEFQLGSEAGP